MITLTFRDIKRIWHKFRDYQPEKNLEIHLIYCEEIIKAIGINDTNETFRLLSEGVQFFNGQETRLNHPAAENATIPEAFKLKFAAA